MRAWLHELAVAWRTANQPCRENNRLHSLERDDAVSCGTRVGLRLHRVSCAGCRRMNAQLNTLGDLARARASRADGSPPVGGMPVAVRARLARRLGE